MGKLGEMDLSEYGKIIPVNCSPAGGGGKGECSGFKILTHFYINMKLYFFLLFPKIVKDSDRESTNIL